MNKTTVVDIMTKEVISVTPDTSLVEAVGLMHEKHYNGLPVVNETGVVIGILTEHDLMLEESYIHFPTFLKLLQEFPAYKKDKRPIKEDIKKIFRMKVQDAMNKEPLLLYSTVTLDMVFKTYRENHRVNSIPIIDEEKKLIGIISRYDVVKFIGAPSVRLSHAPTERELDANIDTFLNDFESRFILVDKVRTRLWFFTSIAFFIIGFLVSAAFLIRISF